MSSSSIASVQATLNAHGFPCGHVDGVAGPRTKAAVARFQTAWAGLYGADGYGWLLIDGIAGEHTQRCLAALPNLSWHFTVNELRSKGDRTCYVDRQLVAALEHLRGVIGPFSPLSAYRDPAHNAYVGGARNSMHLHGLAADVPQRATVAQVQGLNRFSGIGDKNGKVAHVDLRHLSGHNATPHATPNSPARWNY